MGKFIKRFENFDINSKNSIQDVISKLPNEYSNLNSYTLSKEESNEEASKFVYYGRTPEDIRVKYKPDNDKNETFLSIRNNLEPFSENKEFQYSQFRPSIINYFENELGVEIDSIMFSDRLIGWGTLAQLKEKYKQR